jgi:hypothetical protein
MASEASPAEGGASETEAVSAVMAPAPRGLRLGRAAAGVVLLGLAWAAVMGAFLLATATLTPLPAHNLASRLALYAVGIIGVLWLAIMALGAIIVGAFCLMLAFTTRQW